MKEKTISHGSVLHGRPTRFPGPPRPSRNPIVYQTQANLDRCSFLIVSCRIEFPLTSEQLRQTRRSIIRVQLHHILNNYLAFEIPVQVVINARLLMRKKYFHIAERYQSSTQ